MKLNFKNNDLLNFIKDNFYSYSALFVGFIAIFSFYLLADSFVKELIPNIFWRLDLILSLFLIWALFWIFKRNVFPQTSNGKIGLIFAIQSENDLQQSRIKFDFAKQLTKNVQDNNLENLIDILILNNYQSSLIKKAVDDYSDVSVKKLSLPDSLKKKYIKNWIYYQNKLHGHFFVTGYIKTRNDELPKYFLENLEGLVIHKEVNENISILIKNEFIKSWWNEISFPEKFEIKGFTLAADLIYLVVKYIVGIAALVSGDTDVAIKLHENLGTSFLKFQSLPPNLESIKKDYVNLLAEEYLLKARKNIIQNNLSNIETLIHKSLILNKNNYSAYLLGSLFYFYEKNYKKALNYTEEAKKYANNDGTWRYNRAFLLIYLGQIKESYKLYSDISKIEYRNEDKALKQVFEFLEKLIIKEPQNNILNFILGYLYLKKENNLPQSLKYFELYLKSSNNVKSQKFLKSKAIAYKKICEKNMQLN